MSVDLAVRIHSAELERQLGGLAAHGRAAMISGLRELAFGARDAVRAHVAGALRYSGPGTQRFVSQGFRLSYRTEGDVFRARIFPRPKTAALLVRHLGGHVNRADSGHDLSARAKVAIPVGAFVRRGASGRVATRLRPAALLAPGGRGFVNRAQTAVLYRRRSGDVEIAYALRDQTRNPDRIDVPEVVQMHVRREAGRAFARAIARRLRRAGIA